jgi:hypothetical protein
VTGHAGTVVCREDGTQWDAGLRGNNDSWGEGVSDPDGPGPTFPRAVRASPRFRPPRGGDRVVRREPCDVVGGMWCSGLVSCFLASADGTGPTHTGGTLVEKREE